MMESCALNLALVYRWDFGLANTHHHLIGWAFVYSIFFLEQLRKQALQYFLWKYIYWEKEIKNIRFLKIVEMKL